MFYIQYSSNSYSGIQKDIEKEGGERTEGHGGEKEEERKRGEKREEIASKIAPPLISIM